MPAWLKEAVFYEIYPQSFYDTNADGIGDLEGIIQKLDYVESLGCNALWLNPCFDSPFKDAGYDVRDYKKVAPRYGTNEELIRLFKEAHARGMHVLLDLVAGHTSEEHVWFRESQKAEKNEYSNRYIWTDFCFESADGFPYIGGESERSGVYLLNFFKSQPALNYGFYRTEQRWQLPMDHPDCIATREALKDVMRFWLDAGCDGFRVDMASSLVKNDDEKKSGTSLIWQDIRRMLDAEYPEAALLSEWSNPQLAIKAGFHMDFCLDFADSPSNGYRSLLRDYYLGLGKENFKGDRSFFKKDAGGDITRFLKEYLPCYENTKQSGYYCLITGNHDTVRAARTLSKNELKLAYAFLLTMPGVPFLYYGDEIGMRYLELGTKEGGYLRTGSRTPMQWSTGKNLGFSSASEEKLYLPVDGSPDAPTVEKQEADPDSLLQTVRAVLRLRGKEPDLQAEPNLEIVYAEEGELPFVYRRGGLLLAVNPSSKERSIPCEGEGELLFSVGDGSFRQGKLTVEPQSFVIFRQP